GRDRPGSRAGDEAARPGPPVLRAVRRLPGARAAPRLRPESAPGAAGVRVDRGAPPGDARALVRRGAVRAALRDSDGCLYRAAAALLAFASAARAVPRGRGRAPRSPRHS